MPHIQLANVACGGHVGDAVSMEKTILMAKEHQVKVGAHPSYPDRENWGRARLDIDQQSLASSVTQQITKLNAICLKHSVALHHVKPHGALYHDMMTQPNILILLLQAISNIGPNLFLIVQAGLDDAFYRQQARRYKIKLLFEAFADRAYLDNGKLVPRDQAGSLYTKPEDIIEQSRRLVADTICFHSDNPASVAALQQLSC